jgi:molecular chaperone Hsp33
MTDLLVAASARDAGIEIFAAITTDLVGEIARSHDLWPTATAAVGRLTTGAVLFGAGLQMGERVSLQINGHGPIGMLSAEAWMLDERTIGARGYARNGNVDLPIDARGKFDVGGAVGKGSLQVTRSHETGQPYVGVVALHSGEIAEDLAVYLAQSEQIPSVVALGVLANPEGVSASGGVLARVLPGTDERAVAKLEERAVAMPPVTELIARGANANELLQRLAGDLELRSFYTRAIAFACRCNRDKVRATLLGFGDEELERMAQERDETTVTCEYCKQSYTFTAEELRELGST